MRFEYAPCATPIDVDETKGPIPAHLALQSELNEYEESNILEARPMPRQREETPVAPNPMSWD
jgi:hypothetical protein